MVEEIVMPDLASRAHRHGRRWWGRLLLALLLLLLVFGAMAGCASMEGNTRQRQVASMPGFPFPGKEAPVASGEAALIDVPLRIGVAFVPGNSGKAAFRLAETDRPRLAGQVRNALANYALGHAIEAVPALYLEPGGGFDNLDRVAKLPRPDVIALISCDQVQFSGANK
ncbi:MAG: hypothetical protein C0505_14245 [Leptothrix sp. (in: Bacteria)]|nr:hypothetical protein [Leptothrix sp. (in: b-proteobacteria)]